jgi:hypothetical protein
MLIDTPQATDTYLLTKFMQHARSGQASAQVTKPPPGRLLGQLRDNQIERVRRG